MAVKIVSRYDSDKVLHAAETAVDVRAALVEAVKQGADLQCADLRGANLRDAYLRAAHLQDADLRDADLRGAHLRGANLRDADLRGANLRDANLRDANLQGADLQDAHLQGADLRDANLRGANLRDANLRDANLQDAVWAEVADVLQRALSKISIDGHWIKGSLTKPLDGDGVAYCAIGAVRANDAGTARTVAEWLLAQVAGGSVEAFNDAEATTLEDVKAVFGVAIMHARRWAGTAVAA